MSNFNMINEAGTLHLTGLLSLKNVKQVWNEINSLGNSFDTILLNDEIKIDSSGIALLTHYVLTKQIKIQSANRQIHNLLSLYDLNKIITTI